MRAEYDSAADAISIQFVESPQASRGDEVHPRAVVALDHERPVALQLLYPELGIDEPLTAAADRYRLDLEALRAAARSALSAPNRVVALEVASRSTA